VEDRKKLKAPGVLGRHLSEPSCGGGRTKQISRKVYLDVKKIVGGGGGLGGWGGGRGLLQRRNSTRNALQKLGGGKGCRKALRRCRVRY